MSGTLIYPAVQNYRFLTEAGVRVRMAMPGLFWFGVTETDVRRTGRSGGGSIADLGLTVSPTGESSRDLER